MSAIVRAPTLHPRDRVAVVAPAGPLTPGEDAELERGLGVLRSWGLHPVVMPHVHDVHGHLAGRDADRAADLDTALRDGWIRAVFAARGGYGTTRILGTVAWEALAEDPRLLVGFSDLTALLLGAWTRLGLVGVHGQFVTHLHRLPPACRDHLWRLLSDPTPPGPVPRPDGAPEPVTVHGGRAEGRLVGGNLSLLRALVGTAEQPDLDGAIVFLEDVNESPYRIDRALTHLLAAGLLDQVAGVVVGEFRSCDPAPDQPALPLDEVVADRLGGLGVPVLAGLSIGHVDRQVALPVGVRAELDADAGELTLLEPAVHAG